MTMRNLAERLGSEPLRAELALARVLERDEAGGVTLELGGQRIVAARAASCLLRPEPGDEVLCARCEDGRAFVTAVLSREGTGTSRLELDGDVELRAGSGRLDLAAREGVSLRSPRAVELVGAELGLTAAVGRLAIDNLSVAGKVALAAVDSLRLVAKSADTVVDRALQRFKLRVSRVEQVDQQRAGMLQQEIDGVHSVQSDYSLTRARNEVRVDGKQIIMG